jgi:hypothetical protein
LPASYFKSLASNQAFVDGITAAVTDAIAVSVIVIATRTVKGIAAVIITLLTVIVVLKVKK